MRMLGLGITAMIVCAMLIAGIITMIIAIVSSGPPTFIRVFGAILLLISAVACVVGTLGILSMFVEDES